VLLLSKQVLDVLHRTLPFVDFLDNVPQDVYFFLLRLKLLLEFDICQFVLVGVVSREVMVAEGGHLASGGAGHQDWLGVYLLGGTGEATVEGRTEFDVLHLVFDFLVFLAHRFQRSSPCLLLSIIFLYQLL
jgi:hypothetical protein